MIKKLCLIAATAITALSGCNSTNNTNTTEDANTDSLRIVSVNGTVSEVLAELGLLDQIVGTDVASTYPASLKERPKVGHNRQISTEGILVLDPNIIIGTTNDLKPETIDQLKQTGIRVLLVEQEYNTEGTVNLIRSLADSLQLSVKGDSLLSKLNTDLEPVKAYKDQQEKPKVLFIYARGTGTMVVGGTGTQVDEMITLAGGVNVAKDIQEYKPLTAEALVAYNPDVILLFDSGLSSLGGVDGILEVQGVKETNAGKNKKVVEMDGQFLTGFGPRVASAIEELHTKIH